MLIMLGHDVIRFERKFRYIHAHATAHEMRDFNYLYFPLNWH